MAITRRKLIIGTGVGAGVLAAGGGVSLLTDNLPDAPETLLKIDALPSDDPTPGWFHTSQKRQPKPALVGDAKAPWVVIGGGFAGLAAARQLALNFPQDQVILVEAQQVGFGTSGRNAGFLIDVPHDISAPDYIGDKTIARNILNLNQTGQRILKDLVEEHNITEAHMRHSGKYQAAVEDSGIAVLDAYRGGLEALGQNCKIIEGKELPDIFGTSMAWAPYAARRWAPCWLAGKRNDTIDYLLSLPKPEWNPPDPLLTMGVNFTLRRGMYEAGLEA